MTTNDWFSYQSFGKCPTFTKHRIRDHNIQNQFGLVGLSMLLFNATGKVTLHVSFTLSVHFPGNIAFLYQVTSGGFGQTECFPLFAIAETQGSPNLSQYVSIWPAAIMHSWKLFTQLRRLTTWGAWVIGVDVSSQTAGEPVRFAPHFLINLNTAFYSCYDAFKSKI